MIKLDIAQTASSVGPDPAHIWPAWISHGPDVGWIWAKILLLPGLVIILPLLHICWGVFFNVNSFIYIPSFTLCRYPDSKQCRHRSGPHLAHMDFTRARCGPDLGQHYVAVWVGLGAGVGLSAHLTQPLPLNLPFVNKTQDITGRYNYSHNLFKKY